MPPFAVSSPALLLCLALLAPTQEFKTCLPSGIKLDDVVETNIVLPGKGTGAAKKILVQDKLIELKAHCKGSKLVDGTGKQIRFYRLKGCWGNPPAGYLEILERQNKELESLKKRYTVIEMTCNPTGALPY